MLLLEFAIAIYSLLSQGETSSCANRTKMSHARTYVNGLAIAHHCRDTIAQRPCDLFLLQFQHSVVHPMDIHFLDTIVIREGDLLLPRNYKSVYSMDIPFLDTTVKYSNDH